MTQTLEQDELKQQRLKPIVLWLSRVVMLPPILVMIMIGVRYSRDPIHAASLTGVALTTPEALTDTRVVGALAFTVAFAIASSAISVRRLRVGHLVVIALMTSFLALRLFGFTHDGTTLQMGDQKVKTLGEFVFLCLNTVGFILQSHFHPQRPIDSSSHEK